MGLLSDKKYYYFRTKYGVTTIQVWSVRINTSVNKNFVELTDEQVTFYLSHPDASVDEVRNCRLFSHEEPTPELSSVMEDAEKRLKDAYITKMNRYKDIDVALAVASRICIQNLWLTQSSAAYTTEEAKDEIKGFVQLGKSAKKELADGLAAIRGCTDADMVDSCVSNYISRMEAL